MKKTLKFCTIIKTLLLLFAFVACSNTKNTQTKQESLNSENTQTQTITAMTDDYANMQNLFNLNYDAQVPEQEKITTTISLDSPTMAKNVKDVSVIPQIRSLSEYTTNYIDHLDSAKAIQPQIDLNSDAFTQEKGDLEVASWGPKQELPAAIRQPSFYVIFTQPVKAISALSTPSSTSDIMTISPHVDGVFRWYGSRHIAFEAKENIDPLQEYTISVKKGLLSLGGKELKKDFSFTTCAEPLKITQITPGYTWAKEHSTWIDKDNVIPEAANEVLVAFNYPVDEKTFKPLLSIFADKDEKTFSITKHDEKSLLVHINDALPYNSKINIKVKQPIHKNETNTQIATYLTLRNFSFKKSEVTKTRGEYLNPVYLYFSQDVDYDSILKNISTEPSMPITKDNIKAWGSTILIHSLPVKFDSHYTINIHGGLQDIYGRNLSSKTIARQVKVHVPEAASYVNYLDYGSKMLEAQFAPKLLIEYQNVFTNSKYAVTQTTDPLNHEFFINDNSDDTTNFNTVMRNTRLFEQINLDKYLTNGKGWISLDSQAYVSSDYEENKIYKNTHYMTVQVTDLGITARYGINKAVILVTSLQTGLPIEGASVYLFGNKSNLPEYISESNAFAFATTNSQGLAILTFTSLTDASNFFCDNDPAILVRTDDDKAVFEPESHNPWREGIYNTKDTDESILSSQKTFMFTDRGIYQPGETVTFKGIDRDKQAGTYTPYTGAYSVSVQEDTWRDPKIISTKQDETSTSGGFWNSFVLPEDLDPGRYCIEYERLDESYKNANLYATEYHSKYENQIYFTVAYFQRLKYQSAITLPKSTIISGDQLSGTVKATYLSGGGLSNAHYEGSWFKQAYRFTSDNPTFKNFTFGPQDAYASRSQVDTFSGSLSSTGEANISCKTGSEGLEAVPYRYIAQCEITDTSNQLISTSKDIIVHPASVYIGLSKPIGITGFAKKNTDVSFKYILAAPSGKPLENLSQMGSEIEVSLIRDDWKIVQQRGAEGSIYANYVKESTAESTQTIKSKLNDTITVKPQKAGVYTLKTSGMDTDGHAICTEYKFYVTGSGYVFWNRNNAASLRLTPDQSMYNPGDTAKVLLESPLPKGDYLITVEREGIFTEQIMHFDESCAVFEVPIAQNYVPVVYVSICSYSTRTKEPDFEYGEEDTDKPKGYYGVAEIEINPRVKAFSLDIVAGQTSYLPGEKATITLRATKGGKPLKNAELTLMAVDRGVLDLINYHVPNPIDFFYDKYNFPLSCFGGDSRSMLMDPVTYEIKNLQGGDGDGTDDKSNERKDFNPTAVFLPELKTDANGEVTATFTLPDTLTTYRVTAFGVQDDLLALQESEIAVQNPINVLQVMPPRLRERDTAEAGVLLYNLDSTSHKITVSASVRSPAENSQSSAESGGLISQSGEAFIDGESAHTITIASGQNVVIYFDLAAKKAGTVEVVFGVKSDILTETLVQSIKIDKPYITETFTSCGTIGEKDKNATEGLAIPSFAENGIGSVQFTLDATRLGPLSSAVQYVFDYPYDCMEQQSAALYPLIAFEDYIDVFGLDNKVADIRECAKSTFIHWKDAQLDSGGFPYWPDGDRASFFVSLRIAHIVALAKNNGYSDKDIAINTSNLVQYLRSYAQAHSLYVGDYQEAYYNYVLSLLDEDVFTSRLFTLANNNKEDITIQAFVGMTYLNIGDKKNAQVCADQLTKYFRPTARGAELTKAKDYGGHGWYSNSTSEDYALAMELLVKLDSENDMVTKILFTLLENQKSGYWHNTIITARVLEAVHAVIESRNLDKTDFKATAILDDMQVAQGEFKGAGAKPITITLPLDTEPISTLKTDTVLPLEFEKKGKGTLYYTTSLTYALPEEMQIARDEGIGLNCLITEVETGKVITPTDAETPIMTLESGKTYSMELTIDSGRDRTYLALRAPIPSGAEVLNTNFVTTPGGEEAMKDQNYNPTSFLDEWDSYWYEYWYGGNWMSNEQIFDNEVRYFWDQYHKGSTKASFKFRAARRGVYVVPPITAECMYEPEIFGRTHGYLFVIK